MIKNSSCYEKYCSGRKRNTAYFVVFIIHINTTSLNRHISMGKLENFWKLKCFSSLFNHIRIFFDLFFSIRWKVALWNVNGTLLVGGNKLIKYLHSISYTEKSLKTQLLIQFSTDLDKQGLKSNKKSIPSNIRARLLHFNFILLKF